MPKSGQAWDSQFLSSEPLFRIFEPLARPLRQSVFPDETDYTRLAEEARRLRAPFVRPLSFVRMQKPPRRHKRTELVLAELYDGRIALKSEVPCLPQSYHDLLNAMAFAAFPKAKRALHARQFAALKNWVGDSAKLPGKRTREQDALTIFDEGGVVLVMTPAFFEKWQSQGQEQTILPYAPDSGVLPLLFGHALLEHLISGWRDLRASAVVVVADNLHELPVAPTTGNDVELLLSHVDQELEARLCDSSRFVEPGADCIFTMTREKSLSIGPPKPSWTGWNPGDREKISKPKMSGVCSTENDGAPG